MDSHPLCVGAVWSGVHRRLPPHSTQQSEPHISIEKLRAEERRERMSRRGKGKEAAPSCGFAVALFVPASRARARAHDARTGVAALHLVAVRFAGPSSVH